MRRALLGSLVLLLGAGTLPAQTAPSAAGDSLRAPPRTLQAARAAGEIRVDGRLDEAAWSAAGVAGDFVESYPNAGVPARLRTEARILYDAGALYVGMRMYDPAPDSIAAQLSRRDTREGYSDWVGVMIDSYHDRRTGFAFGVNPRGVKRDVFLFNDRSEDFGWDAVWDVATQVDSLGWTAEFRIPLGQLRFAAGEPPGGRVWGLQIARDVARNESRSTWSPWKQGDGGFVSRFGRLTGLSGLAAPRRAELQPYSVARLTRAPGNPESPFYRANDPGASVGADFKYGVTSNLTLTGTVNPDFGQVEADASEVNLSAFESFFPERRPFFVEGMDIFRFGFGGGANLFYSRRIGRRPQGSVPGGALFSEAPEATTILGAAKLSGKTSGGWSVGVLEALTAPEEARYAPREGGEEQAPVEPLTNYGVARVVKDFRGGQSALGGIFTTTHRRLPRDGTLGFLPGSAYAAGVDGRHRFGAGNYELSGWLAASDVQGSARAIRRLQAAPGHYFQRPDADHLEVDTLLTRLSGWAGRLSVGKIGGGHWTWNLQANAYSPGLEVNDLGFHHETDRITPSASLGYRQFQPGPVFRNWGVNFGTGAGWSFGGEQNLFPYAYTGFNFQLKNYWGGSVGAQHHWAYLSTSALRGGPALLQAPNSGYYLSLYSDRRRPVNGSFTFGDYFDLGTDRRSLFLSLSLAARPSPRATVSLGPMLSSRTDPEQYVARRGTHHLLGEIHQVTTALTTRLNYTFTPTLSLELYAQPYISAGDYVRFREVRDPRARNVSERFHTFSGRELAYDAEQRRYRVDLDGDGRMDADFRDPDFNFKQLRSNAVLRWEYRPGSTLFVVWSQGRTGMDPDGSFRFGRDAGRLFGADPTNVLLVKLNYWLSL
jgi:hypothetical protein